MPPLDDSTAPDTAAMVRPGGDGSRVASPDGWNEAAVMIAGGAPLKSVAERLGCSRTTLWRTLQRSERLRTRILEEQRFLAVEAARGTHGHRPRALAGAPPRLPGATVEPGCRLPPRVAWHAHGPYRTHVVSIARPCREASTEAASVFASDA